MCVDTYVYIPIARFFLVGLPMDCLGIGGGVWGWGLHHGPGLGSKMCPVPQKHY